MLCMLCSRSVVSCRGLTSHSCHVLLGAICASSTAECTHSIAGLRPGKHAKAWDQLRCPSPVCSLKTIYSAALHWKPSRKRVAKCLDTEQQHQLCRLPNALETPHALHMLLWTTRGMCCGKHCPALPTPACCLSTAPKSIACLTTPAVGAHRLGRIERVLLLRRGAQQQLTQLEHRLKDCEVAQFRWWAWASTYRRRKVCTFSHTISTLCMHCQSFRPHLHLCQPSHLSVVPSLACGISARAWFQFASNICAGHTWCQAPFVRLLSSSCTLLAV